MEEHHRMTDSEESKHHRKSDDIIIELLDIVQRIDSRLEAHIKEEMGVISEIVSDQNDRYQSLVETGFPDANPEQHRVTHQSLWQFIRSYFK